MIDMVVARPNLRTTLIRLLGLYANRFIDLNQQPSQNTIAEPVLS